jgi:hypothetical protein
LRVHSGFIIAPDRRTAEYSVQAVVGPPAKADAFLAARDIGALVNSAEQSISEANGAGGRTFVENGYWLFALAGRNDAPSGILAAERPAGRTDLTDEESDIVAVLVDRASVAVEDVQLQRSILDTLKGVAPNIEQVQQWGSQLRFASPLALAQLEADPLYTPEFHHAVREALSHYWGGPKLTGNRLLTIGVVQEVLAENSNSPSQALRAVLRQAVETMRPADERDPMSSEWILYNILRLRFLQGKRVKEIVQELAMSESDFYRKERAAIREVARALAMMENACVERHRQ